MKVIVEVIMGRFIDVEVSEDATVKELKEKIALEVKVPAKRLIIMVGDEETRRIMTEYENEMLLRDLGVKEYSHVHLFFKNLDLVSREERFREEEGDHDDDDPMEEISSEAETRRQIEEEEEKMKIGNEKEEKEMKNEEDGDEKVEDEEEDEKLNNGDATNDVEEEAREDEGDNKEETLSRVS